MSTQGTYQQGVEDTLQRLTEISNEWYADYNRNPQDSSSLLDKSIGIDDAIEQFKRERTAAANQQPNKP